MKFSEHYSITKGADDDWFDPVLNIDTKLFIDPFLIYSSETGNFIGSHDEIISFFNNVFMLLAKSGGNPRTVPWKKAENLLKIHEVSELCLGYTKSGTRGSAAGSKLEKQKGQVSTFDICVECCDPVICGWLDEFLQYMNTEGTDYRKEDQWPLAMYIQTIL